MMPSYLCASSRVLRRSTCNQLRVSGHEVLVDAHVLLLGENRIVGFKAVFL